MESHSIAQTLYKLLTLPLIIIADIAKSKNYLNIDSDLARVIFIIEQGKSVTIQPILLHALVLAEDKRFFYHSGMDHYATLRAIFRYIIYRKIEGASTIEQQLFRVVIGDYRLSFRRKAKELLLSILINRYANKIDIAVTYLLNAYYGHRALGLFSACDRLSITLKNITAADAATLVAAIRRPMPRLPTTKWKNLHFERAQWIYRLLLSIPPPNQSFNPDVASASQRPRRSPWNSLPPSPRRFGNAG